MTADPFSGLMGAAARKLLGDPNARLSTKSELRFGSNGSLSVDLDKGTFFDHEADKGGGVLDLLARVENLKGQAAIDWLTREVGGEFEDRRPANGEALPKARIIATYDYADEHGEILYQVCRYEPKTFKQRRPDPSSFDGWSWSARGLRQVPYRLADVMRAIRCGETVYIVEGEKDADNLAREGFCATCNAMGAGKWPPELGEHFKGADVVILPDNDDAGANHAQLVASSLKGLAKRVRTLDLPGLPPKGDVTNWLEDGGDGVQLIELVQSSAKLWTPEPPKSRFGAIQWADIDRVNVNYAPLIKGLIYQGDKGMVFGESGSGKSFLAVDMGLSIARGVPFLGMKTAQGACLYQAGEGGKGLLKRLKAYRLEHRITGDVPFILLPEKVNLFSPEGDTEAFISECVAWKAALADPLALIVIDTFSTASPGANENDSADMGRMLDAGDRLNKATGAAILWVHHKNAAGIRERGHTSFRANIETAIEVIKDTETKQRTLHLVKLKDGEDGLKIGFELQSVTLGTDDDGDLITSCVVRPAQVGTERTSNRYRLPGGQRDFLKVLDTAVQQYGGVVPGVGAYGAEWDAFRELYVTLCGTGKRPDAIRQSLSHNGNELWRAGLIERHDPWLWVTEKGAEYL